MQPLLAWQLTMTTVAVCLTAKLPVPILPRTQQVQPCDVNCSHLRATISSYVWCSLCCSPSTRRHLSRSRNQGQAAGPQLQG